MTEQFPNNSSKATKGLSPETEKHIEKIIDGPATLNKPSGFKRFRSSFIAGDASSVSEHVFWNLIIPGAKDLLADLLSTSVDMMIYGEKRGRVSSSMVTPATIVSKSRINYAGMSSQPPSSTGQSLVQVTPRVKVPIHEIRLRSRAEADIVLQSMQDVLTNYPFVTVADLYSMVGHSPDQIDYKWGWTSVEGAEIKRLGDGILLNLPTPQDLG